MAIRLNATGDYLGRTANLPLLTSFTIMGWSYIHSDLGGGGSQTIFGTSSFPGSTADVFFSWDNGSDVMNIGSYVSAGAEFSDFGSRPAAGNWFHWYVRCSGSGAGLLQAGWAGLTDATHITAATQLDAGFVTGDFRINNSGFAEFCDQSVAAIKMWDVALTDDEIAQERWTHRPQRVANLNTWAPAIDSVLADATDDWSGNGRDWSQPGTPAIADGPPVSWGGSAVDAVCDPPPVLLEHPFDTYCAIGATASFTVVATGTPTYQWEDNRTGSFTNVATGTGATTATYTTAATDSSFDGRRYRCVVTTGGGAVTSRSAELLTPGRTGTLGQYDPDLRLDGWF